MPITAETTTATLTMTPEQLAGLLQFHGLLREHDWAAGRAARNTFRDRQAAASRSWRRMEGLARALPRPALEAAWVSCGIVRDLGMPLPGSWGMA